MLICDPIYALRDRDQQETVDNGTCEEGRATVWMPVSRCFDLHYLGIRKPGRNTIRLALELEDGKAVLVVTETVRFFTPSSRETVTITRLPLYFDGAHNCIHVDIDHLSSTDGEVDMDEPGTANPEPGGRAAHPRAIGHEYGLGEEQQEPPPSNTWRPVLLDRAKN